jgi:hypothetical protein
MTTQPFATRADLLVVACALALLPFLYARYWVDAGPASEALILAGGAEFATVPLHEDRLIEVPGPLGVTTVEVREGRIRCASSPGPQRICERAGWLSHGGESAISLPNRVVIEVLAVDPRYDSINF